MIKSILRLLAASTSFIALLLITNSAIAVVPMTNDLNQLETPIVSLNLVSPTLQLARDTNSLFEHSGCSCALCTQSVNKTTI